MGLFSKVTKTVKGIAKNPANLKNYADLGLQTVTAGQVDTNGVNGMGSFDDLLNGKKTGKVNADAIASMIRNTQVKGIGELNKALDTPADSIINEQAAREKQGVLTSAQDARRRAQQLMAQRGLQGSSLGLASERSIAQTLGQQNAAIDASLPGRIRQQQIQDAQTRIGVGGLGTADGIRWRDSGGQRSGGLLSVAGSLAPLAGSLAGGLMGGPVGASAGGALAGAVSKPTYKTAESYDYLNGRNGAYS